MNDLPAHCCRNSRLPAPRQPLLFATIRRPLCVLSPLSCSLAAAEAAACRPLSVEILHASRDSCVLPHLQSARPVLPKQPRAGFSSLCSSTSVKVTFPNSSHIGVNRELAVETTPSLTAPLPVVSVKAGRSRLRPQSGWADCRLPKQPTADSSALRLSPQPVTNVHFRECECPQLPPKRLPILPITTVTNTSQATSHTRLSSPASMTTEAVPLANQDPQMQSA
jgi:hypothetical protein